MITFREALKLFKVSQATLYRWIREDNIPATDYWGQKMYDYDTLVESYTKRHPE